MKCIDYVSEILVGFIFRSSERNGNTISKRRQKITVTRRVETPKTKKKVIKLLLIRAALYRNVTGLKPLYSVLFLLKFWWKFSREF
jgi:hypothetical protein